MKIAIHATAQVARGVPAATAEVMKTAFRAMELGATIVAYATA